MPTISERELSGGAPGAPCTECGVNEAYLFLCGEEAYLCSACFAQVAGLSEEEVLRSGDIPGETRDGLSRRKPCGDCDDEALGLAVDPAIS